MIDDRRQRIVIADDCAQDRRTSCLLDLMMPKVTGWEVLTERAAAPELRKIPVIVITAARGDAVAKIPSDGLCALLFKPFDLQTLRALVKSSLRRAEESGAQFLPT